MTEKTSNHSQSPLLKAGELEYDKKKLSLFTLIILCSIFLIGNVSAYSTTVTADLSTEIGQVRSDFYGYSHMMQSYLGNSTDFDIDVNQSTSLNARSNVTWHKQTLLNSGANIIRISMPLSDVYPTNETLTTTASKLRVLDDNIETIKFAHDNNLKVVIQYGTTMPSWLANVTADCTTTNSTCKPNNYTKFANVVYDYLNRITDGYNYEDIITLEYRNEPEGSTYLSDLSRDNISKATQYIADYNNMYSELKPLISNILICTGSINPYYPNMYYGILGNISTNDCVAIHPYTYTQATGYKYGTMETMLNNLITTCTSANCSRVIISEWNINNASIQNNTNIGEYNIQLSSAFSGTLNTIPTRTSMLLYQWSEEYLYNNTAKYPEYPMRWSAVSEPQMENIFYPPYNITKLFATNHKAGNMVYNSSSTNSSLKVVVSKDSSKYYITLTNTLTEGVNVSLDLGLTRKYLRNVETGQNYTSNTGIFEINNLAGYGVLTLDSNNVIDRITIDKNTLCSDASNGMADFATTLGTMFALVGISLVITVISIFIIAVRKFRENSLDISSLSILSDIGLYKMIFIALMNFALIFVVYYMAIGIICSI